jgi:hypothetical protein
MVDADAAEQRGEQKEALERLAKEIERLKTLMELQAIKAARTKPVINTAQIAYIIHETDKGIVVTIYFARGEKIELFGQPGERFVEAAQQSHLGAQFSRYELPDSLRGRFRRRYAGD